MTVMRYGEAIDHALGEAMAADPTVLTWGEDVRLIHRQLLARFGPDRVLDTPISEAAFTYAGVGAAMSGLRPVVEVMLVDFLTAGWSAVVNAASKFADFSGGRWDIPLVIRARVGGWYTDGGHHEQVLWGQLASLPSTSVVCPATPDDAAGLMLTAIQDNGFVVFLEHKLLSEQFLDYLGGSSRSTVDFDELLPAEGALGEVAAPIEPIPLGTSRLRREGADIALISLGVGVHRSLQAAEVLAGDGVDAAVLDLRSIAPLDREAVIDVTTACRNVVVVDEDYIRGGLSGEIAAVLAEAGVTPATAELRSRHPSRLPPISNGPPSPTPNASSPRPESCFGPSSTCWTGLSNSPVCDSPPQQMGPGRPSGPISGTTIPTGCRKLLRGEATNALRLWRPTRTGAGRDVSGRNA